MPRTANLHHRHTRRRKPVATSIWALDHHRIAYDLEQGRKVFALQTLPPDSVEEPRERSVVFHCMQV